MNKLPKSFAVLNDGSQEFNLVIKWLSDNEGYDDIAFATIGNYGGINKKGLPQYASKKSIFDTILTLSEFIELSKEVDKMTSEEFLQDYADKKFGKDSYLNKYSFYDVLQIMNAYCEYKTN